MAINIEIVSDVKRFLAGTKDMEGALNDVAGELDQLAKSSTDAAQKSEQALDSIDGKEAKQSMEELSDSIEDVGDNADFDKVTDSLERIDTKEARDELDKLQESIEDAGDNANFEKLEDNLEEVGDKAESVEERVGDAFRDMAKKADQSGDKIGTSTKRGFDKASRAADDFKQSANESAQEAASSFDGSVEGIADALAEVSSEAFQGFGPAAAGAGLAIAAGIGIAVSKMQELAEANNDAQQNVIDLAAEFSDLGGVIENQDIAGRIREWGREINEDNWLTFWVDEAESNFQKYAEYAEQANVNTRDAFRGMKGSVEESEGFLDATKEEYERLSKEVEAGTKPMGKYGTQLTDNARKAKEKRDALGELRSEAKNNIKTQEEAIEIYGIEEEAIGGTTDALLKNIEAREELADIQRGAVESAIEYQESLDSTNETIRENGRNLDINTEKGRENQQALIDLAEDTYSFAAAQIEAGEPINQVRQGLIDQRQAFIEAAQAAGYTKAEAKKLADTYGLIPDEIITDVGQKGAEKAGKEIDEAAKDRKTDIGVKAHPVAAGKDIDNTANKKRNADIGVTAHPAAADDKINDTADKPRNADIDVTAHPRDAERDINHTSRNRGSDIGVDANTSGAERDLNYTARDRTARIHAGLGSTYEVDNYIVGLQGTKIYVDVAPRLGKGITN